MGEERRAHERFACDLEVQIAVPGQMTLNARTIDISRHGICVLLPAAVRPGSEMTLGLKLLLPGAQSDGLQVPGRAVWCTPTQGQFQLGATFGRLDETTARGLEVLLQFLSGQLELPSSAS